MRWKYKCKDCGEKFEADVDYCGKEGKITCSVCGGSEVEEVPITREEDFRKILSRFMTYGGG